MSTVTSVPAPRRAPMAPYAAPPTPAASRPLRLGLLDLAWVEAPRRHVDIVRDMLEVAPLADTLGYSRYWLGEHHSHWVAHGSPELLLPLLAGLTTHLRVGTAGVLLSYYSPYKIAANFRLLEALFPDRIDLGIARGKPDHAGPMLLDGRPEPPDKADQGPRVDELLHALRGQAQPTPSPLGIRTPDVWLLGSARQSAQVAATRGTAFSLALFFHHWASPDVLERYRAEFRPSAELTAPRTNIAVAGACAETSDEASRIMARYGNGFMLPTVVGSPAECAEQLYELAATYRTDEIVFMDVSAGRAERMRTCELLAAAVGLVAEPAVAA
jgi:luciferase family oxidoreductase group 1